MTGKERFLAAIRNELPDRVPVVPDISNYIPCKRSGLPFWEIYFEQALPLWRLYLEAADYYGIEHWVASSTSIPVLPERSRVELIESTRRDATRDAVIRTQRYRTPDGELECSDLCYRADPPTHISRLLKDLERDFSKLRWLLAPPSGIDRKLIDAIRDECARRGQAFGLGLSYPGFQSWEGLVTGSIETLSYASVDNPALLDEWFELDLEAGTRSLSLFLETKPDYLLLGGSGTLTLASPELAQRYAIPAIKRWSRMAKEAGVPTLLHSCGKSRIFVDMLVDETDVSCINPLEIPPMGDVDLAELKAVRGKDIALMGNLHTTEVMLRGTPDQVYRASVEAIAAAGTAGGFILSTGDQCPRDTPDENLFAMVRAANDYGRYDGETGELLINKG